MAAKWAPTLTSVASSQASVATSASSTSHLKGGAAVALPSSSLDQAKLKDSNTMSARARRRREEAVRRLVADVHRRPEMPVALGSSMTPGVDPAGPSPQTNALSQQQHDWLVASTVATALERGLDRDLHAELVQEMKDNSSRIGQVCHEHSDAFLESVNHVVTLVGGQANQLSYSLNQANDELQSKKTAGRMLEAASWLHHMQQSSERSQALAHLVRSCHHVAVLLERARKQASLGRPRAALDAVDEARQCLTAPAVRASRSQRLLLTNVASSGGTDATSGDTTLAQDTSIMLNTATGPSGWAKCYP